MKTIPVNKWTIGGAILTALLLVGIGGASASSEPKTETRTVTEYKTKKVEVPGKTKYELSDVCRKALVNSTQNMADFNGLVGQIGDAIVEFGDSYNTTAIEASLVQQKVVIADMLGAVKQTIECDPTIGQEITLPE